MARWGACRSAGRELQQASQRPAEGSTRARACLPADREHHGLGHVGDQAGLQAAAEQALHAVLGNDAFDAVHVAGARDRGCAPVRTIARMNE